MAIFRKYRWCQEARLAIGDQQLAVGKLAIGLSRSWWTFDSFEYLAKAIFEVVKGFQNECD